MSVAECKLEILGMLRSASYENSTSSFCGGCGHPIDVGKALRAGPASPRGLIHDYIFKMNKNHPENSKNSRLQRTI